MKVFRWIFFLFCFFSCISCAVDEQCRQNKQVHLGVDFYHVDVNLDANTITRSPLKIDSLTVKGLKYDSINSKYVNTDSVLYNNSKSISAITLPLHKFENLSMYQIRFNTKIDTLTVLHTNSNDYLSLECGCIKVHFIDTVLTTHNFVDSIHIINHNVNNIDAENIRIFK